MSTYENELSEKEVEALVEKVADPAAPEESREVLEDAHAEVAPSSLTANTPASEVVDVVADAAVVRAATGGADAAAGVLLVAMQQLLQKAPMKLTVAPSGSMVAEIR